MYGKHKLEIKKPMDEYEKSLNVKSSYLKLVISTKVRIFSVLILRGGKTKTRKRETMNTINKKEEGQYD